MISDVKQRIAGKLLDFMDVLIDKVRLYQFHPATVLMRETQAESAEYAKLHMKGALVFRSPKEFLLFARRRAPAAGLILEFGVASGTSITHLAEAGGEVHGFDSFEGLPHDWAGRHESKGAYSTGGKLPKVPANVELHRGWFDATLPSFLAQHAQTASFIHVDCDLYSSTHCVLENLAARIVPGTVIAFDEYFNYLSWRENEFKAFREFVNKHEVEYEYIAWSYQQVAVRILAIRGTRLGR